MIEHTGILGTPMTKKQYADHWIIDSSHLLKIGCYDWMADQLGAPSIVIEIGCGTGRSTHALSKKSKVICIEPNEHMVHICYEHLKENGVNVKVAENVSALNNDDFSSQVTIINHDVFDKSIGMLLKKLEPQAIVCWLIGAAPENIANLLNKPLSEFNGEEMPEYRRNVHKRCYELGREIFQQLGTVQVVDRVGIPSWNEKNESRKFFSELHAEICEGHYKITPESTYLRKITQGFSKSQIQMRSEENNYGAIPALISIKAMFQK